MIFRINFAVNEAFQENKVWMDFLIVKASDKLYFFLIFEAAKHSPVPFFAISYLS